MGKNFKAKMLTKSWRSTSESWGKSKKFEGKEKNVKAYMKADKRDITLLVLILRHRITPPVPYVIITEIILSMSPDNYQDLCRKHCKLEGLTEKQKYNWFGWWCKELEKREIMKGGGRWVAAANWESERIEEVCNCLGPQLQGRGPVFELVGEEGIKKLKLQVGRKKEFIKQKREFMEYLMEQNKILKKKEDFIRAKEDQSTLQADWIANHDWRYGSTPDLTILKPKSVIGQVYPFGDFLRPLDEDGLSWNSDFDMATTISASSTQFSSSSLTTWPNSSTKTSSTLPLWYKDGEGTVLKMIDAHKATRDFDKVMQKKVMLNKLGRMEDAQREGRLINNWMISNSVEVC